MKKLLIVFVALCVLALPTFALAAQEDPNQEVTAVVGEDIEIGEDEMKIVSIDEPVAEEPIEDEDTADDEDRVVGDDIEIGEGEFKIISVEEGGVVGDDIEIEEGEFKIISYTGEEEKQSNPILPLGIGAGVVVLAAGSLLLKKKLTTK